MPLLRTTIAAALLTAGVASQATALYSEDFEAGAPAGLSGGAVTDTLGYAAVDGGVFGRLFARTASASAMTLRFTTTQAATDVSLGLDLAIIDSWDGGRVGCCGPDTLAFLLDGATLLTQTFDNYNGDQANLPLDPSLTTLVYRTPLGFTSGHGDSAYRLQMDLGDLAAGNHTLAFRVITPFQGGADESYAVDNVRVEGTLPVINDVPEPGSLAIVAAGLGLLALRRRRG